MSELSKNEQIKLLSEQLLKLIASQESDESQAPSASPVQLWKDTPVDSDEDLFTTSKPTQYFVPQGRGATGGPKAIEETLQDFERMGIDVGHIRRIMETVDRRHGSHSGFASKESLFEELQKLMK